jgi:hypothetical protein
MLIDHPLWIAGTILYSAEGAKSPGSLSMANADQRALRLFVAWVRTYLRKDAQFSPHLYLHEGTTSRQRELTGRTELAGTGHRKNHLEHGVCTVKLRRPSAPWNTVMEWIDALSEQFEVDARPITLTPGR